MDEKTIEILKIIIDEGPISGPRILDSLEERGIHCNIKTVHKVVDTLNYFFSQIGDGLTQIENLKKVGYKINYPYFTHAETLFLKESIQASSFLSVVEKENFMKKLDIFHLNESLSIETNLSFLNQLNTISNAIKNKNCIRFYYTEYKMNPHTKVLEKRYRMNGNDNKDTTGRTYLVTPYEIIMRDGFYYLYSYSDKHPNDVTPFRIDRMESVRTSRKTYEEAEERIPDYHTKVANSVNSFVSNNTEEVIEIRFNEKILNIIVDTFGKDKNITLQYDGSYLLTLHDYAINTGLIGWIMQMSDDVEVLTPLSLREVIKAKINALSIKYKD